MRESSQSPGSVPPVRRITRASRAPATSDCHDPRPRTHPAKRTAPQPSRPQFQAAAVARIALRRYEHLRDPLRRHHLVPFDIARLRPAAHPGGPNRPAVQSYSSPRAPFPPCDPATARRRRAQPPPQCIRQVLRVALLRGPLESHREQIGVCGWSAQLDPGLPPAACGAEPRWRYRCRRVREPQPEPGRWTSSEGCER